MTHRAEGKKRTRFPPSVPKYGDAKKGHQLPPHCAVQSLLGGEIFSVSTAAVPPPPSPALFPCTCISQPASTKQPAGAACAASAVPAQTIKAHNNKICKTSSGLAVVVTPSTKLTTKLFLHYQRELRFVCWSFLPQQKSEGRSSKLSGRCLSASPRVPTDTQHGLTTAGRHISAVRRNLPIHSAQLKAARRLC